jgi:hypothetical protein
MHNRNGTSSCSASTKRSRTRLRAVGRPGERVAHVLRRKEANGLFGPGETGGSFLALRRQAEPGNPLPAESAGQATRLLRDEAAPQKTRATLLSNSSTSSPKPASHWAVFANRAFTAILAATALSDLR